jgi:hypothetical protein
MRVKCINLKKEGKITILHYFHPSPHEVWELLITYYYK